MYEVADQDQCCSRCLILRRFPRPAGPLLIAPRRAGWTIDPDARQDPTSPAVAGLACDRCSSAAISPGDPTRRFYTAPHTGPGG